MKKLIAVVCVGACLSLSVAFAEDGSTHAAEQMTENAEKNAEHGKSAEALERNAEKHRAHAKRKQERKEERAKAKLERKKRKQEKKANRS